MSFNYVPADRPAIWLEFVPAREDTASTVVCVDVNCETPSVEAVEFQPEEEVSTVAEDISAGGVSDNTAGPHIRSVDRKSQLRGSQLAKREYQRDSIRMGKGRTVLSSLVRRLNTAQDAAQVKNVERAVRKMCGPRLGLSSDGSEVIAKTRGRCTDETAVDARVNVDLVGSRIKSSRVASPLWKNCRNHRLRCPKIDWLYCPSPAADSDYLSLSRTTRTRTRRQQQVTSSQMSSNFQVDSVQGLLPSLAKFANGFLK